MKNQWNKLGLLFNPLKFKRDTKLLTHVANPLPIHMSGDIFRIYYSGRDSSNRSSVGAVDIDIVAKKVVNVYSKPFFTYGEKDSFYPDGVSVGNFYEADGVTYILFMGWQAPTDQHWKGDVGRLIVNDDMSLTLDSNMPFIGVDSVDPISLSYPWVMSNDGGYDMWYGSTINWDAGNKEMLHVINYARSMDGHNWEKKGLAVPYVIGKAQAFSRPSVIHNHNNRSSEWEMWFSYRSGSGQSYRIGYAISDNGNEWKLCLENSGIDVSLSGWDSEMIEYPYVFSHKGCLYMLYNGNSYGKTGFGLAILERH